MPRANDTKLLDVLLEAGKISESIYAQLVEEHQTSGKSFDELLSEKKIVDEELLTKARGTILGVPYVDLVGKDIELEVLNFIPREVAETNKAVAFNRVDSDVDIGMVNPRDMRAVQAIDFLARTRKFKPHYFIFLF